MIFLKTISDNFTWLYYVLPIVGILIILFCVIAYFSKIGEKIKDKVVEVFKWGNTEIKISVITVFIIVGLTFIFFWVYLERNKAIESLQKNFDSVSTEKDKKNLELINLNAEIRNLKSSQILSMDYSIELDGLEVKTRDEFQKLKLRGYYIKQFEEDRQYPIEKINFGLQGKIIISLSDINFKTMIVEMEIQTEKGDKKWVIINFYPLKPGLKLSKKTNP